MRAEKQIETLASRMAEIDWDASDDFARDMNEALSLSMRAAQLRRAAWSSYRVTLGLPHPSAPRGKGGER
jgi:hypothetical protein